jgi:hypothetical protein
VEKEKFLKEYKIEKKSVEKEKFLKEYNIEKSCGERKISERV